jgi:hypothetical protein
MNGLKPFWIWLRIRKENRLWNSRFASQQCHWQRSLVNPHIFSVNVKGIVQDNLPMYVFSIDIPFKGNQSLSNMRSNVTRCHICTTVSLIPQHESNFLIKKQCVELFAKIFEKKLVMYQGSMRSCFMKKKQRSTISCQGYFNVREWIFLPHLMVHKLNLICLYIVLYLMSAWHSCREYNLLVLVYDNF